MMKNKPELRLKLKGTFMECLQGYIESKLETHSPNGDDDKLLFATLWEIRVKICLKLSHSFKNEYNIKLSPAQSLALRLLYTTVSHSPDPWFMNELRKISDTVHKEFSI